MPGSEGAKRGAVAVLDALGFKGIWRRYDPNSILQRLKAITIECKGLAENNWQTMFQDPRIGHWKASEIVHLETKIAHFSDSVVVCCAAEPGAAFNRVEWQVKEGKGLELFALNYTSFALSLMLFNAVADEPRFVYRGAVAAGKFWFEDPSFILGEAIDEAAGAERGADAAVVRFCESARRIIEDLDAGSPALVPDYPVPLKNSDVQRTYVINPFACLPLVSRTLEPRRVRAATFWAIDEFRKGVSSFMSSDSQDVVTKKKNTERFLEVAASQVEFAAADP